MKMNKKGFELINPVSLGIVLIVVAIVLTLAALILG
jgi:hypothetical protein